MKIIAKNVVLSFFKATNFFSIANADINGATKSSDNEYVTAIVSGTKSIFFDSSYDPSTNKVIPNATGISLPQGTYWLTMKFYDYTKADSENHYGYPIDSGMVFRIDGTDTDANTDKTNLSYTLVKRADFSKSVTYSQVKFSSLKDIEKFGFSFRLTNLNSDVKIQITIKNIDNLPNDVD